MKIAAGPVSWGVDFADDPSNVAWSVVLDEMVSTGVSWLELGPYGYLPTDADLLHAELDRRGLKVVGSFMFEGLQGLSPPAARELAAKTCEWIASAGGCELTIVDRPDASRASTAGRSDAAGRLTDSQWTGLMDTLAEISEVAESFGLVPAYHPHAGTTVEFGDEVERLLSDPRVEGLGVCVDTGHSVFADIDPAALVRSHPERIAHVHLKDVDPAVLAEVRSRGLDYWAAVRAQVFCPLGEGAVEFRDFFGALQSAGYDGPATVEQDRRGRGTPVDDLRRSLSFLGDLLPPNGAA